MVDVSIRHPHHPDLHPIRTRALRLLLSSELHRHGRRTVTQLVDTLDGYGLTVEGRPSKAVSDALRWEVRNERVRRVGRGLYEHNRFARSEARRIVLFATTIDRWLKGFAETPDCPPEHVHVLQEGPHRPPPAGPPWIHLGWLWRA